MRTVAAALTMARECGVNRLDAQLLLAHALGRPRTWLLANDDAPLSDVQQLAIQSFLRRRAAGEPLAYLTGEKEFHGLALQVTRDVLLPRPESETLVDWALEMLDGFGAPTAVVDLGTGSGAIALAIAHACPAARVCAVDISAAALDVARANGKRLGLDVEWLVSNWWSNLAQRQFDLVVSNPPYVASGDPHLQALKDEPQCALVSGTDGLDALRDIAAAAPRHMRRDGWLLVEHADSQAAQVQELLRASGLRHVATRRDLSRRPRCSAGQR